MSVFPKFVDEAASPPAQAVGSTVADIWNLTIGNHVSLWTKKQQFRQQQNYQDYVKKVEEKTKKIPEENLVEPQLHIIGPAIEASKYYIESEDLRDMFANLIASSINQEFQTEVHPAFVEIIKQLSPYDALIVKKFKENDSLGLPIVQIKIEKSTNSYSIIHEYIIDLEDQENYKLQASSLSNLQRLGLLNIDFLSNYTDSSKYSFANTHLAFQRAKQLLPKYKEYDPTCERVDYETGIVSLTPFARNFIRVCM